MKEIILTKNKVTFVDDEDFEWLSQWSWQAHFSRGKWYVTRSKRTSTTSNIQVSMHREIMRARADEEVDHQDGDGLNNQKYNLRLCMHVQNSKNISKSRNQKSSKYLGVSWNERRQSWVSYIGHNYKMINLGRFKSEEDAAKAHDLAALKYHGEYANLNFPEMKDFIGA